MHKKILHDLLVSLPVVWIGTWLIYVAVVRVRHAPFNLLNLSIIMLAATAFTLWIVVEQMTFMRWLWRAAILLCFFVGVLLITAAGR